jgi:hypothetical protein
VRRLHDDTNMSNSKAVALSIEDSFNYGKWCSLFSVCV